MTEPAERIVPPEVMDRPPLETLALELAASERLRASMRAGKVAAQSA